MPLRLLNLAILTHLFPQVLLTCLAPGQTALLGHDTNVFLVEDSPSSRSVPTIVLKQRVHTHPPTPQAGSPSGLRHGDGRLCPWGRNIGDCRARSGTTCQEMVRNRHRNLLFLHPRCLFVWIHKKSTISIFTAIYVSTPVTLKFTSKYLVPKS